jgi:hypothetical protein
MPVNGRASAFHAFNRVIPYFSSCPTTLQVQVLVESLTIVWLTLLAAEHPRLLVNELVGISPLTMIALCLLVHWH